MIVRYENTCVGCPQGCIHCGRDGYYPIHACDRCEAEFINLYKWDDGELCLGCIIEDLDLEEIDYEQYDE